MGTRPTLSPPRRRALRTLGRRVGFTLIELMVALAIGAFIVAALYQLFRAQMAQFVYQDLQMEMHQNARLAADILTRSGRMAGLGSSSGTTVGALGNGGNAQEPLSSVIFRDNIGNNGSDVVTFVSLDPSLLINTAAATPPPCGATTLNFSTTALHNAARIAQYRNDELMMCYDPASIGGYLSYLWRLNGDGDPTTGSVDIEDASIYADFQTVCNPLGNLPLVMMCSRAEVATFYIDAVDDGVGPGTPQHPVLMMDLDFEAPDDDDVPVVDNVEDMQLAFCLQKNSALGLGKCNSDADWVQDINASDVRDIYMVRFSLVVRSGREDLVRTRTGSRPALEDNPGSVDTDFYFRQVVSTEVTVRNLRMQAELYP